MRIAEALRWGEEKLSDSGIANARMETLWLLSSSIGPRAPKPLDLMLRRDDPLSESDRARFEERVVRRSGRFPLAYLLGTQEFMGLELEVGPKVLIPRPETELLAEEALKRVAKVRAPRILDLCTGSGCVALALAKQRTDARIEGADLSEDALECARRNAARHGLEGRVRFFSSDLFSAVEGTFDLIVSNPPYVRTSELDDLQKEVRFEPRLALDGGEDGLAVIRRLADGAPRFLNPAGWLLLETGYGQSDEVLRILEAAGLKELGLVKDYSGIERIALGRRRGT